MVDMGGDKRFEPQRIFGRPAKISIGSSCSSSLQVFPKMKLVSNGWQRLTFRLGTIRRKGLFYRLAGSVKDSIKALLSFEFYKCRVLFLYGLRLLFSAAAAPRLR
jgi:hypothetical protein